MIRDAEQLEYAKAKMLGLVLNNVEQDNSKNGCRYTAISGIRIVSVMAMNMVVATLPVVAMAIQAASNPPKTTRKRETVIA